MIAAQVDPLEACMTHQALCQVRASIVSHGIVAEIQTLDAWMVPNSVCQCLATPGPDVVPSETENLRTKTHGDNGDEQGAP